MIPWCSSTGGYMNSLTKQDKHIEFGLIWFIVTNYCLCRLKNLSHNNYFLINLPIYRNLNRSKPKPGKCLLLKWTFFGERVKLSVHGKYRVIFRFPYRRGDKRYLLICFFSLSSSVLFCSVQMVILNENSYIIVRKYFTVYVFLFFK